ncbi:MAG: hypothetical protein DCC67_05120 [Planctomycetota bacterium]|nr:MAG: hypothetical protein DCC67_05120 [Planctomycetota bacterium]
MSTYEATLGDDLDLALREGGMHFVGESEVQKTLRRLAMRLDELGIDYAIAGAMAMFLHGYRRFTEDVDVLVTPESLARIHDELEGRGYVRPYEKSKNLRDADTRVRIDFLITGQYPGDGKPGPVAFPDPAAVAEVRNGLRVVSLPVLVELKLASGQSPARLKDLGDAQELIRSLQLPYDYAKSIDPTLRDVYERLWRAVAESKTDDR